jgi:DNA-directed RNA polymerase specialized sigma subunit
LKILYRPESEASNRFDPARNLKFKTLAEHRIRGAMLDYLRSIDPLPRPVRQFVRQRDAILRRLKANVSEDDVAAAMGITIERYRRLSQIVNSSEADQHGGSACVANADPPDAYTLTLRRELNDALARLLGLRYQPPCFPGA